MIKLSLSEPQRKALGLCLKFGSGTSEDVLMVEKICTRLLRFDNMAFYQDEFDYMLRTFSEFDGWSMDDETRASVISIHDILTTAQNG